jgi:hypothetical protein
MKKLITIISALSMVTAVSAQFTFTDNFDSYTIAYLGPQSTTWTTWLGNEGTTEDVMVTTTNPHSAPNCVYYSSVAAGGGPTDCVLPFGSQFTTGDFTLDMWMYVNTATGAYFNFQQNTTVGQIWNSDWTFNGDGTLDVINQTGLSFSTTYPQGQWFHLIITVELNNSKWNVNIDGSDMGTFNNTSLGIASIDIFPLNGHQFYIDDISVSHTPAVLNTNDIAISYLSVPGGLSGSTVPVKALLRNVGTATIANPYASLYHNGSLIGSQTFSGLNLASLDTQIVTFTNQITYVASNAITADAQISAGTANDDDTNNDTIILNYTAIVPAAGKMVVAEEGTGTWCGWCPRGAVYMDLMQTTYAGYFQGIAVHNADPMTVPVYDSGLGLSSFPGAKVDRLPVIDPSALEPDFITRIQIAPKAVIVNGAQWNAGTDSIYVSLTTTFTQAVSSGNYKVACVLIEDNVTGSGSGWSQSNYYAGGGSGVMGGYELLPNPVPAAQMEYDFVARNIIPSFAGLSSAYTIPASIGYVKTHNFVFAVPAGWSQADLKIVGLFIDNTGKIDNASSTDIATAINNGYVSGTMVADPTAGVEESLIDQMALYPNPTSTITNLKFSLTEMTEVTLNIMTIDGKIISSHNYGPLNGAQNIEINTMEWANGIYLVEVAAGKSSKVMKLSVQ